jgi:hypothetical protein
MSNELQDAPAFSPATQPIAVNDPVITEVFGITPGVLETMMVQARRFPRDLEKVRDVALFELGIVPDLAARSYYSIPYNQGKKNETRVEGPGIKAAMTLCRNWQWALNGECQAGEDKSAVYINGMFFDVQMGTYTMRTWRVPKFYKPSGGQGVIPKNSDLLQTHIQAGKSKAVRNAILASLPDWLVHVYYNRAKELVINPPKNTLAATQSIQQRILIGQQAIMKKFGVTPEEMKTYIAENAEAFEDDGQLLVHLQGIFNSLSEGHVRIEEMFNRAGAEKTGPAMPEEKK